jgi:SanA protein
VKPETRVHQSGLARNPLRLWRRRAFIAVLLLLAVFCGLNAYIVISTRAFICTAKTYSGAPRVVLLLGSDNADAIRSRTEAVAELCSKQAVSRIVVSGHPNNKGTNEPRAMRGSLILLQVGENLIELDEAGRRTFDSVLRFKRTSSDAVFVVSDDYHIARAVFLARSAGLDAQGIAAQGRTRNSAYWRSCVRETFARCVAVLDVTRQSSP